MIQISALHFTSLNMVYEPAVSVKYCWWDALNGNVKSFGINKVLPAFVTCYILAKGLPTLTSLARDDPSKEDYRMNKQAYFLSK